MKFEFPSAGYFVKTVLIALLLASAGYMLVSFMATELVNLQLLFSLGIFGGACLGAIFAAISITRSAETHTESIFVGNLAFKMPQKALRELFEQYGEVHAVRLMTDRATRKPRGFGFIEMDRKDARAAIRALNGTEYYGREIKVNIANERKREDRQAA